MPTIVDTLREAHRLRRHLRELQAEIERGPRLLKAQQAKLARQEEADKAAREGLKQLKVSVHEKETTLKATHQGITRSEQQQGAAGNQKEYDARQAEIAAARTRCSQLEEEILNGMAEIDERTAALPELDRLTAAAREEHAQFEKQAKARFEHLKAEQARAEAELKTVEAGIPPDVRRNYDRLVKAYGADAFAAVKERICQHCRTAVTGTIETQLQNGQFVCCQSCARGLYLSAGPAVRKEPE